MERGLAWGLVEVPAGSVARSEPPARMVVWTRASSLSGVIYLLVGVIWLWHCGKGIKVFCFSCTGQCNDFCHYNCSSPYHKPGTCWGGGVATFGTLRKGNKGILMYGGH